MNKVAKYLKIGALVLFVLSIVGAIAVSMEEQVNLVEAKYSWQDDSYDTVTNFNASLFFTTVLSSTISCALIYAFGELIDIEDDKRRFLKEKFCNDEIKPESIETADMSKAISLDIGQKDVKSKIQELMDKGVLENIGFIFDGSNDADNMLYFKVKTISATEKIEIKVKDDNGKTSLLFKPMKTTEIINKCDKFVVFLQKEFK